ncbi:hypothetical protein BC940DRAFT_316972 [Gongronella butleri]|nr:hypothetical protein BC940DRAFT_316972 [Gongronella butleri]
MMGASLSSQHCQPAPENVSTKDDAMEIDGVDAKLANDLISPPLLPSPAADAMDLDQLDADDDPSDCFSTSSSDDEDQAYFGRSIQVGGKIYEVDTEPLDSKHPNDLLSLPTLRSRSPMAAMDVDPLQVDDAASDSDGNLSDNEDRAELDDATNDLQEETVRAITGILGQAVKRITETAKRQLLQKQGKSRNDIPDIPLGTVTKTLKEMGDLNQIRHENALDAKWTSDTYLRLVAFMSVILGFLEVVMSELLLAESGQGDVREPRKEIDAYLRLFAHNGDVISRSKDDFSWYHRKNRSNIVDSLRKKLKRRQIAIDDIAILDPVLTRSYTRHLLVPIAKDHQRTHGQFYTPQSVVKFMWGRCFKGATSDSNMLSEPLPRVLDPCMGIGSFLSAYLVHLIGLARENKDFWNNGPRLQSFFMQLPSSIWGIEIDPFAFRLGKHLIIAYMFPIYLRCITLGASFHGKKLDRLCLLCNNTVLLTLPENKKPHKWEYQQLIKLRDPNLLTFDFVVTNPPYLTRATGNFSKFEEELDPSKDLGPAIQAYIFFFWFSLIRLHPERGQACFIAPSHWTSLGFGKQFRRWVWEHFQLLEGVVIPEKRVWPTVAMDSLIVRFRKRQEGVACPPFLLARHQNRMALLPELLDTYAQIKPNHDNLGDLPLNFTLTPTDDPHLIAKPELGDSYTSRLPMSSHANQILQLTSHLPKLTRSPDAPLLYRRGPSTSPIYGNVVRTEWARSYFGEKDFLKYLRPIFYWNWKSLKGPTERRCTKRSALVYRKGIVPDELYMNSERLFWLDYDPERLKYKETNLAEAYTRWAPHNEYSVILVNRLQARKLNSKSRLYKYLKDAREKLIPRVKRNIAWHNTLYNGSNHKNKIIAPITTAYFPNSTPRPRFFLDHEGMAVSAQCMYFLLNPDAKCQQLFQAIDTGKSAEEAAYLFFLGVLNSNLNGFFTATFCRFDFAGRMRFYEPMLGQIPYAEPTPEHALAMVLLVDVQICLRERLFALFKRLPDKTHTPLRIQMRRCMWNVDDDTITSIDTHIQLKDEMPATNALDHALIQGSAKASTRIIRLLIAQSLMQHAIEQVTYDLYNISWDLRIALETEQKLTLTKQWEPWQERLHQTSPVHLVESILKGTLTVDLANL